MWTDHSVVLWLSWKIFQSTTPSPNSTAPIFNCFLFTPTVGFSLKEIWGTYSHNIKAQSFYTCMCTYTYACIVWWQLKPKHGSEQEGPWVLSHLDRCALFNSSENHVVPNTAGCMKCSVGRWYGSLGNMRVIKSRYWPHHFHHTGLVYTTTVVCGCCVVRGWQSTLSYSPRPSSPSLPTLMR